MPLPSASMRVATVTRRRSGGSSCTASTALRTRLSAACSISSRSARTTGGCADSARSNDTPASRAPGSESSSTAATSSFRSCSASAGPGWRSRPRRRWMMRPARFAWSRQMCIACSSCSGSALARLQHAHAAVVVGGDRGERLVELVRHRRGELAERDQARGAVRGVAVLGDQLARAALLGDVGQHAERRLAAVDPAQRMRVQHVPAVVQRVVELAVDDRRRRDVEDARGSGRCRTGRRRCRSPARRPGAAAPPPARSATPCRLRRSPASVARIPFSPAVRPN